LLLVWIDHIYIDSTLICVLPSDTAWECALSRNISALLSLANQVSPCRLASAQARAILCGILPQREQEELGGLNRNIAFQESQAGKRENRLCNPGSRHRFDEELDGGTLDMRATC
jgi:hypothetical protein